MILVLLGTQNNSFIRLINEIEDCIKKGIINEEVIVQAGHTKFNSDNIKSFDFLSSEELQNLIQKADLIITHGGVGSITSCLKQNKKVIAVARLKEFGEHVNDHQIQIINVFDSNGYLKGITKKDELEKTLKEIKNFKPNKFVSNNEKMLKIISNFIDNN